MLLFVNIIVCVFATSAEPLGSIDMVPYIVNGTLMPTRRIMSGRPVGDTRPYMVYLRAAPAADAKILETKWLCGGVIVHERYILTSAACIEDAKHFYVVSGTHKWHPAHTTNECIQNGAKKAVWKCVPKSYYFDGEDFDNIRWMVGDIAVVKVEDNFNFERRIRGCDFIPKKVDFNNRSAEFEKAGTMGSIAGWGTKDNFGDGSLQQSLRSTVNSPELMETDVQLVSKKNCKKRWEARYHFVIDEHMICTRDGTDDEAMSAVCSEREVNCKELAYTDKEDDDDDDDDEAQPSRRMILDPSKLTVHTAYHIDESRRTKIAGGFCENDHGGPLIVGQGKSSIVVGVMSACLTRDVTRKCYGPFLYTSVYRYRNLISCAIDKDLGPTCRRLLRSSKTPMFETFFDWTNHTDGPALSDSVSRSKDHNKSFKTTTRTPLRPTTYKPLATPRIGNFPPPFPDDTVVM